MFQNPDFASIPANSGIEPACDLKLVIRYDENRYGVIVESPPVRLGGLMNVKWMEKKR